MVGGALGQFSYNSLADLESGRPARFTRSALVDGPSLTTSRLAVGVSDIVSVPRGASRDEGLIVQYGLRADLQRFPGSLSGVGGDDGAFGHSLRLPSYVLVEPMAGFTWTRGTRRIRSGPAVFTEAKNLVSGGVREYVSPIALGSVESVAASNTQAPGLMADCVGSAVPVAAWDAFTRDPSSLPTGCLAPGSSSGLALSSRPAALYARGYTPARSWRADLSWTRQLAPLVSGTLSGTYARNVAQTSRYDLNFVPASRFVLASEGGRPVFVPAANIVPATGALTSAASRFASDFGHVTELRSDMQSRVFQVTTGLSLRFGTDGPRAVEQRRLSGRLGASYTYSTARTLARGFDATTAGDPRQPEWAPSVTPTHSFNLTMVARLRGWATISTAARLTSGFRYTPRVNADVNGDGYANDRAFVFDPAATDDPGLAAAMRRLLGMNSCLRRDAGRISRRNGCVGPWNAALGVVTVQIDPYRIGLGNRGALTLYLTNALGGVDQLLHGASHAHGWGQFSIPDPTLLVVRGFDDARRRFQYEANPRFGRPVVGLAGFGAPFGVTLDLRLDVGPDPETHAVKVFARPVGGDGDSADAFAIKRELLLWATPLGADLRAILHVADSIALSPMQRDSIIVLQRAYTARRDSIYGELARYLAARHGDYDGKVVRARWHDAISASVRATYAIGPVLRTLLRDDQYQWLETHHLTDAFDLSPEMIDLIVRAPFTIPR